MPRTEGVHTALHKILKLGTSSQLQVQIALHPRTGPYTHWMTGGWVVITAGLEVAAYGTDICRESNPHIPLSVISFLSNDISEWPLI